MGTKPAPSVPPPGDLEEERPGWNKALANWSLLYTPPTFYLFAALALGLYDWAVMQIVLQLLLRRLTRFPGVDKYFRLQEDLDRAVQADAKRLRSFRYRGVGPSLHNFIFVPGANWLFMGKLRPVMVYVTLCGIPLDLLGNYLSNYVLPLPRWGVAARLGFWDGFLLEVVLTVLIAPYLVMAAAVRRAERR